MKILSIIFSFYILVLNMQPLLDRIDVGCEGICISTIQNGDAKEQQPTENHEGGCDDLCNPFLSCSTCLGCTVPISISFSKPFTNREIKLTLYQNFNSFQYSGSIWQPPKIG